MKYSIRKATINDAEDIDKLLTLLIRDEKKYDSNTNEFFTVDKFYENIIPNDSNAVFVATCNNKIIGYLFGYILNNGDVDIDKTSKLDALFVLEEYRNNGIATNLINEFKEWSINNKAKYMEVQVLNDNEEAYKLYSKEKFVPFKSILINKLEEI